MTEISALRQKLEEPKPVYTPRPVVDYSRQTYPEYDFRQLTRQQAATTKYYEAQGYACDKERSDRYRGMVLTKGSRVMSVYWDGETYEYDTDDYSYKCKGRAMSLETTANTP